MAKSSQFALLGENKNGRSTLVDIINYYNQHNEVQPAVEPLPHSVLKLGENGDLIEDEKDIGDEQQLIYTAYKFMDGERYIFTFNDYSHNNETDNLYNPVLPFNEYAGFIVVLDYNQSNLVDLHRSFTTNLNSVLPRELIASVAYVFTNCESELANRISHLSCIHHRQELSGNWFCFQSISNTGEEFQANKNEFNKLINHLINLPRNIVPNCKVEDLRKRTRFSSDEDITEEPMIFHVPEPSTEEHSLLGNQLVNRSYLSRRSKIICFIVFLGAPIILILVALHINGKI